VAVFLSLGWMRYNWRERLLLAWVGLRGASPIILATFPLLAGTSEAGRIFNIVFFVVLISVLLQGPLARWLRLYEPNTPRPDYPIQFVDSGDMRNDLSEKSSCRRVVPGWVSRLLTWTCQRRHWWC